MSGFVSELFTPASTSWVQRAIGLGHPIAFRAITQLGDTWGILLVLGLTVWLWEEQDTYAVVGILVAETLVSLLLNQLFSIPRPSAPAIVKYDDIPVSSFHSGHVFVTTLLWGLLYQRRRIRWWTCALAILAVSVSRLYRAGPGTIADRKRGDLALGGV